ncbi:sigma-54-dependent Fis family transcriptional regulator [candidate division KSB1 bacterium]|nr:sigma-54-dependent Fis family transcriptional regulator [candidate division KSB1 bacterium]
MSHHIVIIDDEKAQVDALAGYFKKKNFTISTAYNGTEGLRIVGDQAVDVVITDFRMPDMSGIDVLKQVKEINPEIAVIIMTAFGSIDSAIEAMHAGATDYLTKPIDLDQLQIVVDRTLEYRQVMTENRTLREQLRERHQLGQIISSSGAMEEALNIAARVAPGKTTVLITGESGTGKELIARAIHEASPRSHAPFVAVNCAALAENLLESELFGHEKGAFTGAVQQRKGRFERAHLGTLFIDEVGEIPLATQVKLLRVLQEQAFERVGGTELVRVDVRIIAATNQNLEEMIEKSMFREDLYYRLNVVRLNVPALRYRKTDIPLLIDHFLKRYAAENSKTITGISKEALDMLMKYDYPGNVRELENIIEQSVVLSRSDMITTKDLPATVKGGVLSYQRMASLDRGTLSEQVENLEIELIKQALEQAGDIQTKAAELLGITERNLRYKIQKYHLKS